MLFAKISTSKPQSARDRNSGSQSDHPSVMQCHGHSPAADVEGTCVPGRRQAPANPERGLQHDPGAAGGAG